ncbi:MAG: helix-turn-helix domain-containing protein [Oscillospiraceae bacterium]|nr:helix-turn-helix domain-containing protein [Oscillospiraceae bacterium]
MNISDTLSRLRKESGRKQAEVADFINRHSANRYSYKNISHWETGRAAPPTEPFLLLCEFYGVHDVLKTFRGIDNRYRGITKLNTLGKSRVEEYISALSLNPLFAEPDIAGGQDKPKRNIRLYDIPAAAGTRSFLDSDSYEDFEADATVPKEADFAVKISGDSMTPRFADGQTVFVREQKTLDIGDIGIFELDGNSFVKKLGNGELISFNRRYAPIKISAYSSFYILGKVVG